MTILPRKRLLKKLLFENHLDYEERFMIGVQSIKISEIKSIIGEHFKKEKLYPVVERSDRGFLHDGYIIEKIKDQRFALHFAQYGPWGDYRGSSVIDEFDSFDAVIETYFKNMRKIDGIKIEKD